MQSAEKGTISIYGNTHAAAIEAGAPARVATAAGPTVTAGAVVVATNSPIHTMVALHTKQAAYRSYVVSGRVAPGSLAKALYWDTGTPPTTTCACSPKPERTS